MNMEKTTVIPNQPRTIIWSGTLSHPSSTSRDVKYRVISMARDDHRRAYQPPDFIIERCETDALGSPAWVREENYTSAVMREALADIASQFYQVRL